jgi:hypothetical protein
MCRTGCDPSILRAALIQSVGRLHQTSRLESSLRIGERGNNPLLEVSKDVFASINT